MVANKHIGIRALVLISVVATAISIGVAAVAPAKDKILLPPVKREACSSNGAYCVELIRPEELRPGLFPTLTIFAVRDGQRIAVGQRRLQYPIGPRFVFVSDGGKLILFDEWLRRVETAHAIEIFDKQGDKLKSYTSREVFEMSGQSTEAIVSSATAGPWLASEPVPEGDNQQILFSVGTARLSLDLSSSVPILHRLGK